MSKLSDAIALVNAAQQSTEWDTSGECIVVRTTVFEKDGSIAGVLERNYNDDRPEPEEEAVAAADGDVAVGLMGNEATGKGA